jgi:hypothetical protein
MSVKKKPITKAEKKKKETIKRSAFKDRIDSRLEFKKISLIVGLRYQYSLLIKNATDKVRDKYDRKLSRRIAKLERTYKEKKTRQIKSKVYKKELKPIEPTQATWKQKAFTEVCLYAKISRAD